MKKHTETTVPLSVDTVTQAIDYIEHHLLQKTSPEDVACSMYISVSALNILFKTLVGLTVMQYLRNRRLSLAAQQLRSTEVSIIDLAYKYGYETPEAFTKAFTRCFGIPPSIVRRTQAELATFTPITLSLSLAGGWESDHLSKLYYIGQENSSEINYDKSITKQGGTVKMDTKQNVKYHVCTDEMKEQENWRTLLALSDALTQIQLPFKVDGKTMIFAHGLEFPLDKICVTFSWNDEDRVRSFFDYEGKDNEKVQEKFKYFDAKFRRTKIRCMFFNDITEDGSYKALFRNAEPVDIDNNIIMVQTLEFFLANAEKETEYYKMVETYLKEKNQ